MAMGQFTDHRRFQSMNGQGKILKVVDIVVVIVIVISFLLFWLLGQSDHLSGYVEVWKDGQLVMVLRQDGRYELRSKDRHVMDIVLADGKVHVENSDCPLKICERTGKVGPNGTIVCVPNKVVVKFVGKSEVDVMTW